VPVAAIPGCRIEGSGVIGVVAVVILAALVVLAVRRERLRHD
jgi:hypothetical protein